MPTIPYNNQNQTDQYFPSEEGLEVSQDKTDLIRPNSSVGFNRLLGELKGFANEDSRPRWHCLLVNGLTVYRNNYNRGMTDSQILNNFIADLDSFSLYVNSYIQSTTRDQNFHLPIVVYIPDYSNLPVDICRPANKSTQEMSNRFLRYQKQSRKTPYVTPIQREHVTVAIIPAGNKKMTPQRDLRQWFHYRLMKTGNYYAFTSNDPLTMITNCPVDLHIAPYFQNFCLWESYTARILQPTEFGDKLSKCKGLGIPFRILTHRLFGDKIHIKPTYTPKITRQILEVATKTRWKAKSDRAIMHTIRQIVPESDLRKLLSYPF